MADGAPPADGAAVPALAPAGHAPAAAAAEAAARRAYGKLVAFLAARTRDVAGAEDALAEAFAEALRRWPDDGVPVVPEAWLLTVARRRMADALRDRYRGEQAVLQWQALAELADPDEAGGVDDPVPDRRLNLLFACAHPGIDEAARAPLMLQVVLGFDAATIGSAFLVAPAAMSQRLVRAKARIRQAGIPFELPSRAQLPARLPPVLGAIYAAFTEGWADPEGTDARRRNLTDEALWLGRLLAALLPGEPEVLGLLSLMLHTHARRGARRDDGGDYVPLDAQDTRRWDGAMIDEAEALLRQAHAAGRAGRGPGADGGARPRDPAHPPDPAAQTPEPPGRYQLEAAVQSAHAVRRHGGTADWPAIVGLYEALVAHTGSPVAALNLALARSHTEGPQPALRALQSLADEALLSDYQPYWAARAELLQRCGRIDEAGPAYQRAIGLESDPAVRRFLLRRAATCHPGPRPAQP